MKILTAPSSGSIAGTVFSHNRAGQYTRNRRTPVIGTRTPRQGVVKGNMAQASRAWQLLSAADQNAWTSFANAHPIVDALGQSIKLTGHQFFVRINAALLNTNNPTVTAPPSSVAVVAEVLSAFAVAATGTAFAIRVAGSSADSVAVAVAKYTSNGANFQKTFHQVEAISADNVPLDLGAFFEGWAGTPSTGNKAWLRLVPVNADGVTGQALISQTSIIATMPITAPVATSPAVHSVTFTFAGGPATAQIIHESAPTSTGPWSQPVIEAPAASPTVVAGQTTGTYVRGALYNPATGTFSDWSNAILVT